MGSKHGNEKEHLCSRLLPCDTTDRPEVTERRSVTHKGTERERIACRKTLALEFPDSFSFRQGLSHMELARFWPFRTTIGGRRESSFFRYLIEMSPYFPHVYQQALSLVLANPSSGRRVQRNVSHKVSVAFEARVRAPGKRRTGRSTRGWWWKFRVPASDPLPQFVPSAVAWKRSMRSRVD